MTTFQLGTVKSELRSALYELRDVVDGQQPSDIVRAASANHTQIALLLLSGTAPDHIVGAKRASFNTEHLRPGLLVDEILKQVDETVLA